MLKITFWFVVGIIVILYVIQMIYVIPVLKKRTSQEEKMKRYTKILILNSLMMLFVGVLMMLGIKEKGAFGSGVAFFIIGLCSLLFSILNIVTLKNKKNNI